MMRISARVYEVRGACHSESPHLLLFRNTAEIHALPERELGNPLVADAIPVSDSCWSYYHEVNLADSVSRFSIDTIGIAKIENCTVELLDTPNNIGLIGS